MDLFKTLFNRQLNEPLQRRGNIEYEVQYQSNNIANKGFEIIEIINKEKCSLILYRHFYDLPEEEEREIVLKIRIINDNGLLYPEPVLKAFFNYDFSEIELGDIEIEEHLASNGYGGILLNQLINIAVQKKSKKISGWISRVDEDHMDRLTHFYKKHHFVMSLKESKSLTNKIGDIVWINPDY
ncbi:hypothetical protein [Evansella halocellulosilytica]|uniref:hypothetical protein n=1 Tax=Evansella halocellulosilytica TaxID=2011013 RepID=UPI000BB70EE1|nr:hypothetical protein [Evansella halocellulosilytica]